MGVSEAAVLAFITLPLLGVDNLNVASSVLFDIGLCMRYTCTGSLSRMGTFASAKSTAPWMRSRNCW